MVAGEGVLDLAREVTKLQDRTQITINAELIAAYQAVSSTRIWRRQPQPWVV